MADSICQMIDAFVAEPERDDWYVTLAQIRGVHGCPCTTTTHTVPRERSVATGMMWMECEGFVPGRPVSNCGLCFGLGVHAPGWWRAVR
jgi:hypothetical protein